MLSVFFFWEKACVFMGESPFRYALRAAPSALSVTFGAMPSKKEMFVIRFPEKTPSQREQAAKVE